MKLVVLGATGGTGLELVRQAIERGHSVTALVRSPEKLNGLGSALRHRPSEAADQRTGPVPVRPPLFIATQKVNRGKNNDLDRQADHEELLVRCWSIALMQQAQIDDYGRAGLDPAIARYLRTSRPLGAITAPACGVCSW